MRRGELWKRRIDGGPLSSPARLRTEITSQLHTSRIEDGEMVRVAQRQRFRWSAMATRRQGGAAKEGDAGWIEAEEEEEAQTQRRALDQADPHRSLLQIRITRILLASHCAKCSTA